MQPLVLAVAQERRIERVLGRIVESIAAQPDVALTRVWLIEPGDVCEVCRMRTECPDRTRCLHLVASAGASLDGEPWTRVDGDFARFPLGVHKVGRVGATGSGMLLHDMSERSSWIARPAWASGERVRSFAAQPLSFRGETIGVVGAFSRSRIDADAFAWLRAFADHAAVAIANARAFGEVERRRSQLEQETICLRADAEDALGGGHIVGDSPAVRKLLEQIELVAPTDAAVLVLGESGTGKELVARRIHERSGRVGGPFIAVRAAAVAPDRLERELFGAVSTVASRDHAGRLHAAGGGTIFLDEIAAIPFDLQTRLLPLVDRAADTRARPPDVRVVAATNRDLHAEVAAGRFREDLYFRLSVLSIVVPPLRDRPSDVALLVDHFLRESCARLGRQHSAASARELRALERHPWPGNVRELAATVERAVVLATGDRLRFELPSHATRPPTDVIPAADWRRRERANLEAALAHTNGRIYGPGGAAELLGVPPTTLVSRAKALGIERRR